MGSIWVGGKQDGVSLDWDRVPLGSGKQLGAVSGIIYRVDSSGFMGE